MKMSAPVRKPVLPLTTWLVLWLVAAALAVVPLMQPVSVMGVGCPEHDTISATVAEPATGAHCAVMASRVLDPTTPLAVAHAIEHATLHNDGPAADAAGQHATSTDGDFHLCCAPIFGVAATIVIAKTETPFASFPEVVVPEPALRPNGIFRPPLT